MKRRFIFLSVLFLSALNALAGYDPTLGRWLSRDPLENAEVKEGANLYTYVANNPVNYVDPNGLKAVLSKAGIVYNDKTGEALYWSNNSKDTQRFIDRYNFWSNLGSGILAAMWFDFLNDDCDKNQGGFEKKKLGDNQAHNQRANDAARDAGLNKEQGRQFHDEITGQGNKSYDELRKIAEKYKK